MCKGKSQGNFHMWDVSDVQFGSSKKDVKVSMRLQLGSEQSREGR